ncbi:MAG: glycosyltransferase family 2 protein [Nitrospira sp.]
MIEGKKVIVVMPAYNAARTLRQTCEEVPREVVDEVILVDDHSTDETLTLAKELNVTIFAHDSNYGYGRNQKTCYAEALKRGADIVVMIHPDYQYTPRLARALASMISSELYDVAIGSRILGGGALKGGMPVYKYVFNRMLTALQNLLVGSKLSEFHTGYRAFSKEVLRSLPLNENSDGFIFDNEMLVQALYFGHQIGEISCPTKYFEEASSIKFVDSCVYGMGVVLCSIKYRLQKMNVARFRIFSRKGRRLEEYYACMSEDSPRLPSL